MTRVSLRRQIDSAARLFVGRLPLRRDGRGRRPAAPGPAAQAALEPTPEELALESRLVWMMGSPRTGSTWLLRLLIHPWVLAKESPSGLRAPLSLTRRRGPDVVPIDESYLLHHLTPYRLPPQRPGHPDDPADFVLNSARATEPAYFFGDQFEASWRPAMRRLVLARFGAQAEYAASRHSLHNPLIVIKEPNGSRGAEILMRVVPSSRLLFVLRDGRDVVDSLLDALRRGSWASETGGTVDPEDPQARRYFIVQNSRIWVACTTAVQRAYDSHDAALRLLVRYEDLRADTEAELRRILDWVGLERSDAEVRAAVEANAFESIPRFMKGPGTPRRAATTGLWRENMSPEDQAAMMEIMEPKLVELGYTT